VIANTYSDTGGVQKLGLGTAVLQGTGTAGAGWLVGSGILNVQNGGAAGGGVEVSPGATLQVQNNIALPVPITLGSKAANPTAGLESVSGNNTLTGPINVFSNSTMSIDSGSILTVTTNPLNLNTFTLTANVAGTATISSAIQGAGGLTKTGAGVLTLSGNNTFTGPTMVGAGTLLVNGTGPSSVTVASGATLGGTGTTGPLTANGTVSPGAGGPGVLHTGNATFNGGSTFAADLNGTTVGSGYDQLFATGAITLSGPTLAVTVGFASAPGNVFAILQSTGPISGAFAGLPEGFTFTSGGRTFRINYTANAVTLTDVGPARILGDINGDGFVDVRDYGVWRTNFGQTNCGNAADLDGNCIVDIRDYGIWRQHFGEGTPADRRPGAALPAGISPAPRGTSGLVAAQ
jgi:fibronectin-binding autotransporter adhesin